MQLHPESGLFLFHIGMVRRISLRPDIEKGKGLEINLKVMFLTLGRKSFRNKNKPTYRSKVMGSSAKNKRPGMSKPVSFWQKTSC